LWPFLWSFLRFVKTDPWEPAYRLPPGGALLLPSWWSFLKNTGQRAGLLALLPLGRQRAGSTEVVSRVPFTGPASRGRRCTSRRCAGAFRARRRERGSCAPAGHDPEQLSAPVSGVRAAPARGRGAGRGASPLKELLGIKRLSEAIDVTFERDEIVYVPLPHPSGASTWLNIEKNKERLTRALAALGV
jgi:hypothetical protein